MTYFAGTHGLETLGIASGDPRIECDGCGVTRRITGLPPAWFLANKAPPGWRLDRSESSDGVTRSDYCGTCKKKPRACDGSGRAER
jgi:hypothetical protein